MPFQWGIIWALTPKLKCVNKGVASSIPYLAFQKGMKLKGTLLDSYGSALFDGIFMWTFGMKMDFGIWAGATTGKM